MLRDALTSGAAPNLRLPPSAVARAPTSRPDWSAESTQGVVEAEPMVKDKSRLVENEKEMRMNRILTEALTRTPTLISISVGR